MYTSRLVCKYACRHLLCYLALSDTVGQSQRVYDVVTYLSTNSLDISSTVEKIHNSHQISCCTGSNQIIILQENINHSNHSHHYTFSHSDLVTGSPENHLITCSCRCTHYSKIHFISFLHTFSYRDLQCTLKGDSSMLCPKLYSRTERSILHKRDIQNLPTGVSLPVQQ